MNTPSHRITLPDPVEAVTTYTETPPVAPEKGARKQPEPKKEDNAL